MERENLKSFDEVIEMSYGKKGTKKRDAFEARIEKDWEQYQIGEAIKAIRKSQHLTQEQLGEMMGVKKARISRIEKGEGVTLSAIVNVIKALGAPVCLDLGEFGRILL
ncbi:MAG: helix-turn-helix domain-containing protein [Candidatus Cryptobacteroides sp.]